MSSAAVPCPVPLVRSVSRAPRHDFSKQPHDEIQLVVGHGVSADAHAGRTVQHLSRLRREPGAPNLRQVHLIAEEFLAEAAQRGYAVEPGDLGENVLTAGLDLLSLPLGTVLGFGDHDHGAGAAIEVTGLRNPCRQIDRFRSGLLRIALARTTDGALIRKVGIMAVVTRGGTVRPGMEIRVHLPPAPHRPLKPV